jgi:hypothetical protein
LEEFLIVKIFKLFIKLIFIIIRINLLGIRILILVLILYILRLNCCLRKLNFLMNIIYKFFKLIIYIYILKVLNDSFFRNYLNQTYFDFDIHIFSYHILKFQISCKSIIYNVIFLFRFFNFHLKVICIKHLFFNQKYSYQHEIYFPSLGSIHIIALKLFLTNP